MKSSQIFLMVALMIAALGCKSSTNKAEDNAEVITTGSADSDQKPIDKSAIHPDDIQIIDQTCLIFIGPEAKEFKDEDSEEAQMYLMGIDGFAWYSYEAGLRFENAGITTIHAQKHYLSFALDGGKEHIVDAKERPASAILYRKGQMPMLTEFSYVTDISDKAYDRIANYFRIDKNLLINAFNENHDTHDATVTISKAPGNMAGDYHFLADHQTNERIIFRTQKHIENFIYFEIEISDDDDNFGFLSGEVLFSIDNFTPEKPFVVTADIGSGIPVRGILIEHSGMIKYFYITESGMDGSLALIEFTPSQR